MGNTNKEVEKKIKRLRMFNELLLAFGRNKITIKQPHDQKHYTLLFLKELLDVHETIEGKEKFNERYPIERRKKFDVKKISEEIIEVMRAFTERLPYIQKEIDINAPKYMNVKVLILPKNEISRELLQKATTIKGRDMLLEESKSMNVMKDLFVPMKNLPKYDFRAARLLEEDKESLLYRKNGKYFLIEYDELIKSIMKIFKKSRCQ